MFVIKRITDTRIAGRVCASFGLDMPGAFCYGAFKDEEVLGTAAFLTEEGGRVTFCGVDTGRRDDIGLIDGMVRAAFSTQRKCGAKTGRIGPGVPDEVRRALSKLGYAAQEEFALADFFAKKNCRPK